MAFTGPKNSGKNTMLTMSKYEFMRLVDAAGFVRFSPDEDRLEPIDWSSDYTAELEKFAGLIISECMGVVADSVDRREPASTYVDKIRQHFGVSHES